MAESDAFASDQRPYRKYHIDTSQVANIAPHPSRFRVKINKLNLARLLIKELIHYRGKLKVVGSAPCVYGVFSGPVGGFSPREEKCVGCLRCTTQYPDIATILPNPEQKKLGDSYFTAAQYDTVIYEAASGLVPVKGQGYRGKFGGEGFDQMWTDMSEIVRPTRDGIHGREFISTEVDIGGAFPSLALDFENKPKALPHNITLPVPLIFDNPAKSAASPLLMETLSHAAEALETLAILPLKAILQNNLKGPHLVPRIEEGGVDALRKLAFVPRMIEVKSFDQKIAEAVRAIFPECLIALKVGFEADLLRFFEQGARIFHLAADYHGKTEKGEFILDAIRKAHLSFVSAKCRDEVTLIGSGGITSAEHLPKAIILGLDLVALDTPALTALQAQFIGECKAEESAVFQLPSNLTSAWGVKRLKNLVNSWRDQLLEIMGAMGLREVRRLRGEIGRAMFQKDCEEEAFSGIEGYERSKE